MTGRISPAVRSPAAWSPPSDSTRRCAHAGTACKARGSPEQGDRRPWRVAALHGGGAGSFRRTGGRSDDIDSQPSFAIVRQARCARKEEEREVEQGCPRRRVLRLSSTSGGAEENTRLALPPANSRGERVGSGVREVAMLVAREGGEWCGGCGGTWR